MGNQFNSYLLPSLSEDLAEELAAGSYQHGQAKA